MSPNAWSDSILIADLSDEPAFSEEMDAMIRSMDGKKQSGAGRDIILNFQGVSYLNSSNLAQLLRLRKIVAMSKRRLRICAVSDAVWSVFLTTGLDSLFTFNDDIATSLASLQIGSTD